MDTQTVDTIDSFLLELSRKDLQSLAKQHEIRANMKVRDAPDLIHPYFTGIIHFMTIVLTDFLYFCAT